MRRIVLLFASVALAVLFASGLVKAQEQQPTQQAGQVWAWGNNVSGELGDGTTTRRSTPVEVEGLTNVVDVAAGGFHNLAVKQDGSVVAWGSNWDGQLGNGNRGFGENSNVPVEVGGLTDAVDVAAGRSHSLALKQNGTVIAWGSNWGGQLGDGTTTRRSTPVEVEGLTDVVAVAAGGGHSLALKQDGSVVTWGYNGEGRLGDGTTTDRHTPVEVEGLMDVVNVAAGLEHSLAVKQDGSVVAWGDNYYGQLGDGNGGFSEYGEYSSTPVEVEGLTDVVDVAAGDNQSLAVEQDGTVAAWGVSLLGISTTPVEVEGLMDVVDVAAGGGHNLAVKQDGSVVAWGNNTWGQLGDGNSGFGAKSSIPVEVEGLTDAVDVAAGVDHSLAIEAKDASEQLADQIALINSYNLPPGIQKTLVATLQQAQKAVDAGDVARANRLLEAYIRQVEAQRGKALTEEQANDLIEAADRIRAVLGG